MKKIKPRISAFKDIVEIDLRHGGEAARKAAEHVLQGGQASKYNAQPVTTEEGYFASIKEHYRWSELRMQEHMGVIHNLRRQVRYKIMVNQVQVTTYVADAVYVDAAGNTIVEDAKGYRTREYQLKKRLMKAVLGIEIQEV